MRGSDTPIAETSLAQGFQIEDVLEILERRKWWIVFGGIIGLALGTALYLLLPPQYESTTTIMVEPQRVPEAYVRSTVTVEVSQQLNTLQQRVTGYSSLDQLIENVGVEEIDPTGTLTREQLMEEIRRSLSVDIEQRRGSAPVFAITYSSPQPELSAKMVRAIADLFISENIKDRAQQAGATAQFLDDELDRIRKEVTKQEQAMGEFRSKRMGSLPSQLEANLHALDRLNFELATNLEAQTAANQRIALLKRQEEGYESASGVPISDPNGIAGALRSAREALLHARGIYTEEHPNVQHLKFEVERLEKELAEPREPDEGAIVTDPRARALHREIEAEQLQLASRRRREERIRAEIDKFQSQVEEIPQREQELLSLTRDYNNLTDTYRTLLDKKYEAAIARNLEHAQKGQRFKLLRPARVPESPASPDPYVLLPGGMAVGLALVGIAIIVGEFRHPAFRSVQRITRLVGLPVFASIPRIDNATIYETPPSGDVDPKLVVYTAPESSPAEQYRGILPLVLDAEDCQVILVTSATRGDGKTLTCMNVAISLATDLNKRVLVIDGDLRRPAVHRAVHVSRRRGLSNILTGTARLEDCAVNSKIPNLTVLPAGPSVRNPLTVMTGDRFLALIGEARAAYDLVMIDSPPLLPVVDTRILRKLADMMVFVIRADATPPGAALRSLNDMRGVAGIVFNSVSPGAYRRYYYHDAYSRYAYGEEGADSDDDESIDG